MSLREPQSRNHERSPTRRISAALLRVDRTVGQLIMKPLGVTAGTSQDYALQRGAGSRGLFEPAFFAVTLLIDSHPRSAKDWATRWTT